jgi:hypothetical protein
MQSQSYNTDSNQGDSIFYFLIVIMFILKGNHPVPADDEGFGCCGYFLIGISYLLVALSFPFSLCCCIKVEIK